MYSKINTLNAAVNSSEVLTWIQITNELNIYVQACLTIENGVA